VRHAPIVLASIAALIGISACGAVGRSGVTGRGLTCTDDPSEPPNAWIDPTSGKSASEVFPDSKAAALADAVRKSDSTKIRELLRDGANPNATGMRGYTLLSWALRRDSRIGFDMLLSAGANPRIFDADDDNVVREAAIANDSSYLAMLLAHHMDPNVPTRGDSEPPISAALLPRCDRQIRMLIAAKGVDLNRPNRVRDTPLIVAASYNDFRHILVLLNAGADPRARNKLGSTFQKFMNMSPVASRSKEAKASIAEIDAWLTAHGVPLEK
jgi:hypothetical protein